MLKFTTIFLACCAVVNAAVVQPSPQEAKLQHSVADKFMNHMDSFKSSPDKTANCFNAYVPEMTNAYEVFEKTADNCQTAADKAREEVDKQVAGKRTALASDVAGLCASFNSCNGNADALSFFNCYSQSGNDGAKVSSSVSYKANDGIEFVKNKYGEITTNMNVCLNDASAIYDTKTSQLSDILEACLKG